MHRSRLFWRALWLALGCAASLRAARAATPAARQLELSWDAPAECPSIERVRAQVGALLPRDAVEPGHLLEARARVTSSEDGSWLLQLTLHSGGVIDGRQLVGNSCQALVDSVAVILALQLRSPESAASEAAPLQAHGVPEPALEPSNVERTAPAAARTPGCCSGHLAVAGTADSAALPRFAWGGRVELGVAIERWSLGTSFSQWLGQEQALAEARAGRGRFDWRTGSVQVCHGTWGERIRLGPCLAAELGLLTARSSDVRLPERATEVWLAALGGVAFWAPLGSRLSFTSSLAAAVPLRRPSFVIEGIGEIYQPRALGVRSSLGLAWRF